MSAKEILHFIGIPEKRLSHGYSLGRQRHQESVVRDQSSEATDISPKRACKTTIAAMAAVSVRSTRGPRLTRENEDKSNASSSSGANPPSGPIAISASDSNWEDAMSIDCVPRSVRRAR